MRTFIVVDDLNNWLAYGKFKSPEAARDEARKATEYERAAVLFVYEVAAETRFEPEACLDETPDPQETPVVFRKWENGDVVAIFPQIAAGEDESLCACYEHIGQHGAGDPSVIYKRTRPALPCEYEDLKKELEAIGYRLRVCKRITRQMRNVRCESLREAPEAQDV